MNGCDYAIRKTCSEGTRHSYWVGICPVVGIPFWTGSPHAAAKFAMRGHAIAFRDALCIAGTSKPSQYEVVIVPDASTNQSKTELAR